MKTQFLTCNYSYFIMFPNKQLVLKYFQILKTIMLIKLAWEIFKYFPYLITVYFKNIIHDIFYYNQQILITSFLIFLINNAVLWLEDLYRNKFLLKHFIKK